MAWTCEISAPAAVRSVIWLIAFAGSSEKAAKERDQAPTETLGSELP